MVYVTCGKEKYLTAMEQRRNEHILVQILTLYMKMVQYHLKVDGGELKM